MSLQRESLGFAPAATQAFSFLVERLGFRLAKQEPTFVRYESKSVFVNIYHGRSSYEIGVEVGPRAQTPREAEEKFMLGDVLVACGESENLAFRRATTA